LEKMKRPSIANSTVLVVGGAGFIGSHLTDSLIQQGAKRVIIIDSLFVGKMENVQSAIENGAILHIDDAEIKTSLEYLFETYDIDIVFNCATKPLVYSFRNPSNAFMTNVQVLNHLLELQRLNRFTTLCHFSSSESYGTALYEPMDEEHPLKPTTTYAAGKASADLMLQSYVRMFSLDAFIVRPFNNYGPRQNFEGPLAGIIPITIKKILNGGSPEIHGSGRQKRDFIYVSDTVDLAIKVFDHLKAGEVVNLTTDQQLTIYEVITTISKVMEYEGKVISKPARSADVISHRGSDKKLHGLISDYNKTDFKSGITHTVKWMKKLKKNK